MPAPKNNAFWKKRSKHGRDLIFSDPVVLIASAYEYFKWNEANPWYKNEAVKAGEFTGQIIQVPVARPMTLEGLTQYLGVTKKYFNNFEKTSAADNEDLMNAITHIREVISRQKIEGAIVGAFNANIVSRIEGLIDKSAVDIDFNRLSEEQLDSIIEKLAGRAE